MLAEARKKLGDLPFEAKVDSQRHQHKLCVWAEGGSLGGGLLLKNQGSLGFQVTATTATPTATATATTTATATATVTATATTTTATATTTTHGPALSASDPKH